MTTNKTNEPPAAGQAADRASAAIKTCKRLANWGDSTKNDQLVADGISRGDEAMMNLHTILNEAGDVAHWPARTLDEMVQDYGWGIAHTGVGCTALEKDLGQHYAYITSDAAVPTSTKEGCTLSFYRHDAEDSEPVLTFTCPDLETAMKMADLQEDL